MARGDYYFSRGLIKGFGKVFFLKVLQEAPDKSAPRRQVGSFVDEIDYGLFSAKCAPGLVHSWDPEYFIKCAKKLPGWEEREMLLEASLAVFPAATRSRPRSVQTPRPPFPARRFRLASRSTTAGSALQR